MVWATTTSGLPSQTTHLFGFAILQYSLVEEMGFWAVLIVLCSSMNEEDDWVTSWATGRPVPNGKKADMLNGNYWNMSYFMEWFQVPVPWQPNQSWESIFNSLPSAASSVVQHLRRMLFAPSATSAWSCNIHPTSWHHPSGTLVSLSEIHTSQGISKIYDVMPHKRCHNTWHRIHIST